MILQGFNTLMAICAVVLIPVFIWFLKNTPTRKTMLLGLFFCYLFLTGSLSLLRFNETFIRFSQEAIALAYIFTNLGHRGRKTGLGFLLLFILVALISCNSENTNLLLCILFLMRYVEVPLLLYAFMGMKLRPQEENFITRLVAWLCIAQIFTCFIKFPIVGITEPYIGTMSSHEGGLTTLFSLVMFGCSISYFIFYHKSKYLWLAAGFTLFAIAGAKRACVFYLPLVYVAVLMLYRYCSGSRSRLFSRYIGYGVVLLPLIFYVTARLNPSFNPEREIWGTFDLDYIINYSDSYLSGQMADENGDEDSVGRSAAFGIIHQHMLSEDLPTALFGNGAGELLPSTFNEKLANDENYRLRKYGVAYGLAPGYLQLLIQVGIIGLLSYILYMASLLTGLITSFKRKWPILSVGDRTVLLCAASALFCNLFIFMTYSSTPAYLNAVSVATAWIIAIGFRRIAPNRNTSTH